VKLVTRDGDSDRGSVRPIPAQDRRRCHHRAVTRTVNRRTAGDVEGPAGREEAGRPGRAAPRLVRSAQWAGVRAGDPVGVSGVRARSASWTFLAHVRNERTGEEWVEVAGGRPGARAVRSFAPGRIVPPGGSPGRAGGSPSLADAPRLPI
jgi:hypothetical protein